MISHIFKMIWNQKRKNLGLLIEVFVSFLVIFAVFSFLTYHFRQYTEPLGFDYRNILVFQLTPINTEELEGDAYQKWIETSLSSIGQQMRDYPEIESASFSSGLPYAAGLGTIALMKDDTPFSANFFSTDAAFAEVMNIPLTAGKWFLDRETVDAGIPIVINRNLKERLFGDASAIGEQVFLFKKNKTYTVVGVIDDLKYDGEFSDPGPLLFMHHRYSFSPDQIAVKLKSGVVPAIKSSLFNDIKRISKGWKVKIDYMDELRDRVLLKTWIPVLLSLIIGGFLIFNVALGLFGVLWQNIRKRKEEIGLRRAIGATRINIGTQIVSENLVLASLSMAWGVFFAAQFPLLSVFQLDPTVYLTAIVMTIIFIYGVVISCSLYPGIMASNIRPAVALHEQ